MSKETLLTMGMLVYNEEKYIGEAIESLLAQTYKDFTLLIVDNASTDRTPQICQYYAEKDARIVYFRNAKNMGGLFSLNYILEQTNTPYFMLCAGHDKWHPCFVEKLLPALEEEKVILSYPEAAAIGMDGKIRKILEYDCNTVNIGKPVDRYLRILRFFKVSHLFYGIWLTQALKNCNFNFETYGSDSIILEQAALAGKFKQYKEVLFWMRQNREQEVFSETIKRQLYNAYGKKQSVFLGVILYTLEGMKAPLDRRHSFSIATKLWLIINVIYYKFFELYVFYILKMVLIKFIGPENYFKLRCFLKANHDE